MRKLPPLNAVRAFEAAARHVSFTKAAEELHVTHGAVSRQVALLEQWCGRLLFRRSSSRLILTEAGSTYMAEVTAALDRLSVASVHLRQQSASITLRLSAPPTFTMRWLIPRISGFQRRHADLELRMLTSIQPVEFDSNLYDVALRGASRPPDNCASVRFMSEYILPICHTDLIESNELRTPRDLAHHTLISYATEPYSWNEWLDEAGAPDLQPLATLNFEQMYFALQAACEGLGIVLVPLFLVMDDILTGRLSAPFGPQVLRRRDYFACFPETPGRSSTLSHLCDWLQEEGYDTERHMEAWVRELQ